MSKNRQHAPNDLASFEQKIRELAKPRPIYTPKRITCTSVLHYDCTVWLSKGVPFPSVIGDAIKLAANLWVADGLTLSEYCVRGDMAQVLFSARSDVPPVLSVARIKGRLQHALRQLGYPVKFSRKVAFRCLGENVSDIVTGYIRKQVRKEKFADSRFAKRMKTYTLVQDDVDLSEPIATTRGRYWYNVHIVLVVAGRRRIANNQALGELRDGCLQIALKKGYRIKALSVMLDHLHIALRGVIEHSPEEIALGLMNNLAWMMGQNRIWQDACYVGTFSEYDVSNLRSQQHKAVGDGGGKI